MQSESYWAYREAAEPPDRDDDAPDYGPPARCEKCGAFFPQRPLEGEGTEVVSYDFDTGAEVRQPVRWFDWSCRKCGWTYDSGAWPVPGR